MLHWSLTLLILVGIIIGVLYWLRRTYAYWWRRRIKYIQPTPLFGNLKRLFNLNASFAVELSNIYFDKRFENEPAVGLYFFHKPCLLIRNLDLAKTVLIKDFSSFSNRYASCDPHNDKMGALNLLFVKNPAWHEIRTKLAPVFTNSNIRQMFPLMEEVISNHILQKKKKPLTFMYRKYIDWHRIGVSTSRLALQCVNKFGDC